MPKKKTASKKKTAKKKVVKKRTTKKKICRKKTTNKKTDNKTAGRKLILLNDKNKLNKLLKALKDGHYVVTACKLAGISESIYHNWKERGQREYDRLQIEYEEGNELNILEDELPYLEFLESVEEASALAENDAIKTIKNAHKKGDWRAAAHFLERRFYKRWRKRERVELTGAGGSPIATVNFDDETLSEEEIAKLYLSLVKNAPDED